MTHRNREEMSLNAVKQAIRMQSILEARAIKCDSDNNLTIEIGKNIIGIIPFSELEYHPDGTPIKPASATSKVNRHIKYIPISIRKEDDIFIVDCSRKQVQKICYDNYISNLTPGDVIDAYVLKIMNYGIFCDIGCGIVALLPTNNISVTHIVNPTIELRGISTLKVVVNHIDENYRVELTHKELLGTWEEEVASFNEDDVTYGTVLSVEEYGVFVRLSQNLSGLADVTELELKPGDLVSVRIQSIQNRNMKIKLTIIDKIGTATDKPMRFKYYITEPHIKDWVYSTATAKKQIESHF
jgi:small subunit ribosomal protein S1